MARNRGLVAVEDPQGVVEPTIEAGPAPTEDPDVVDSPDADSSGLFSFDDQGPEESGGKAGKYDSLIATAFENEGRWIKVNQTFTSGATGNTIRKHYSNEVSETGATIEVKNVRKAALGKKAHFEVWVRAVAAPAEEPAV